jgi:hypothetical protein
MTRSKSHHRNTLTQKRSAAEQVLGPISESAKQPPFLRSAGNHAGLAGAAARSNPTKNPGLADRGWSLACAQTCPSLDLEGSWGLVMGWRPGSPSKACARKDYSCGTAPDFDRLRIYSCLLRQDTRDALFNCGRGLRMTGRRKYKSRPSASQAKPCRRERMPGVQPPILTAYASGVWIFSTSSRT